MLPAAAADLSPAPLQRFVCTLLAVLLGGLALAGGTARAETGYAAAPFAPVAPGSSLFPWGLSVDQDFGEVYVSANDGSVYKFAPNGGLLPFGEPGASSLRLPEGTAYSVAVDESGTPSRRDLYVAGVGGAAGHDALFRFDSQGVPAPFTQPWAPGLTSPSALAVDAAGNLYVAQYLAGNVLEFSPSGEPLNKGLPVVEGLSSPSGLALDANSNLYVANNSSQGTVKLTLDGGGFGPPTTIDTAPARDVAVDASTGDVYVDGGSSLQEFDSSGSPVGSPFGSPQLNNSNAVAIDEATKMVYATTGSGTSIVYSFTPGPKPETPITEACPETQPTREPIAMQVCGTLNPGEEAKAGYHFDYNAGSSCLGGGSTPVESEVNGQGIKVSGAAVNLAPDKEYAFCLVASNAFGETAGQPVRFKTPEECTFAAETAPGGGGHPQSSWIARGEISLPCGGKAQYYFEYGPTSNYTLRSPAEPGTEVDIASEPGFAEASAELSGLLPSSTYHYRLVAKQGGTMAYGADAEVTTAGAPPTVASESATSITQSTATVHAQINPNNQEVHYSLRLSTNEALAGATTIDGSVIAAGFGEQPADVPVTSGLTANTTYYYQVVASNATGPSEGPVRSFTTLPELVTPGPIEDFTPWNGAPPSTTPAGSPPPPPRKTTIARPLSAAQKLARALKECRRKPRRQRALCAKLAEKRYERGSKATKGAVSRKKGKRQ